MKKKTPKTKKEETMKSNLLPYIINKAEDGKSVDVDLYGEIVQETPIDWWTGQPVEGLFIALDQFLKDLDDLKDADKITFHINSIGGDVEAGLSIYNRIRGLKADVTTIVEGIAASAASIIAQAGNTRQVSVGAQTMIHGASTALIGYYNVQDLQRLEGALTTINESIADVYAVNSGKDKTEILRMMKKETWMTTDEAVENGFADEIIGKEEPTVAKITGMNDALMINGILQRFRGIPMPQMKASETLDKMIVNGREPSAIETTDSIKEGKTMTIEELRESYPDLVNQIKDEATTAACATHDESVKSALEAERARIREIDSIAKMVGDPQMVDKAKYDEPITASELAFKAMQAQQAAGGEFIKARAEELKNTEGVVSNLNAGMEDTVAQDAAELDSFVAGLKELS